MPESLRDLWVVRHGEYVEGEVREACSLPGLEVGPHLCHASLLLNLKPVPSRVVASVEDSVKEEDGGAEMRVCPQSPQLEETASEESLPRDDLSSREEIRPLLIPPAHRREAGVIAESPPRRLDREVRGAQDG